MTTFADIRRDPAGYLGVGATDAEADLFIQAAQVVMEHDDSITEEEAIDRIWGSGDWWPRALALLNL